CIIPGCQAPAENCQPHHLIPWSQGGRTDLSNLASLCWGHHRQAELATRAQGTAQPLDVGRTQRTATPAQRRALAVRDGGCIIPGCQAPAENCQPHHLIPWSQGGRTDLSNLASLCWGHHRQADLGYWTITHRRPDHPDPQHIPANNGAPFTITPQPRRNRRT
ncbi:MAG: HNH endonuclease, partial [Candidatus Nanopelagicales bacterium]